MLTTSANLQREMDELEALDATLSSNERILAESMRRADEVMHDARTRRKEVLPTVDDLLVAPTVVGQQLYRVVAEERALDDVLFVLGKALDRGRVGLDVYLKVSYFWFIPRYFTVHGSLQSPSRLALINFFRLIIPLSTYTSHQRYIHQLRYMYSLFPPLFSLVLCSPSPSPINPFPFQP